MEINSQINAPPADYGSGKGPAREGSPSINLDLGIGAGECIGRGPSRVNKQGKSGFTPAQLHELHQQELILKYIVSGLPVPFHLIFPIWKSVARCFGSSNGGIYNQYPSFIGFGHQGFDYRDTMDPEPGRCRRTDGKKWRCSKDVIPDQKYCERHMHRGRQRSRKHVEDSAVNSESGRTLNFDSTTSITNSRDIISSKTHVSVLVPVKLQLATPSSNTSSHTFAASAPTTTCTNRNANDAVAKKDFSVATTLPIYSSNNESNKNIYDSKDTPATITTFGFTSAASDNSRVDHGSIDGKHARYNHLHQRINIEGSSNIKNSCKAGTLVASRIGFSPKSVLQVVGCSSSLVDYRNVEETEFQRCRRTDGKKWQCSKDVIPDQKYCGRHLHRGTKKLSTMSELVTVAAPPPPSSTVCHGPPLAIPKKADEHINLDTSLSISIAASSQQMISDEGISASSSSSSSSSDATTITDENGRVSQYFLDLSP